MMMYPERDEAVVLRVAGRTLSCVSFLSGVRDIQSVAFPSSSTALASRLMPIAAACPVVMDSFTA